MVEFKIQLQATLEDRHYDNKLADKRLTHI
jgi:hypothetical protein